MDGEKETCYELPNGVRVYCGHLRVVWREEGDKMVCRVDCEARIVVPGLEASVPKSEFQQDLVDLIPQIRYP